VFQITTRQLILSSSIALDTYQFIPELAKSIADDHLLTEVLHLAAEIASRSAKHSSDLLHRTPEVVEVLKTVDDEERRASNAVFELAFQFANRTGGMTADLWAGLPEALVNLSSESVVRLMHRAGEFLEFGGSVTLHFIASGSSVLVSAPDAFDDWANVSRMVGRSGNAVLIAFLRAAPQFFAQLTSHPRRKETRDKRLSAEDTRKIRKVLELTAEIAESDAESALAAFRSSGTALKTVSLAQFEEWVQNGISEAGGESQKARRSYFALETRGSNERLQETRLGLPLERIHNILRIYIEGLTGKEVEIAPLSAMVQESRIGDGKTIFLPSAVSEFGDEEEDFRLYKVLAAHGAGQIEFGTFKTDTTELKAAFTQLAELYEATAEQLDAFSLAGYIEDVQQGERALSEEEIKREIKKRRKRMPANSGYKVVLDVFPEPRLARKIFGTMENARIDHLLRKNYRGLRKDLDLMREMLRKTRPYIFDLPVHQVPFELLFQITLCGGATDDARQFYGQIVSEIETVVEDYLKFKRGAAEPQREKERLGDEAKSEKSSASQRLRGENNPTVADSIMATSRVYNLFQNITP
ncbi:MAG TPA: hypothetical protein VHL50_07265, partial [Pyrinomonadaceae bacterium]|nr:hypothetical protein [Pyrinomonadaceae bacterium]